VPNERFTPRVAEVLARLGALVDFGQAAAVVAGVTGVQASEATVRRQTYAAGEAALAVDAAERARLEREAPPPAAAPERLQLSQDATKVPLVGGAWTDVKLAVFGELVPAVDAGGRPTLEATNLSYVARWEPAERFARTLLVEAHRRGVERAGEVISPNDGADWIQGTTDFIAPRAVRILDEPHAAEHLGAIGALVHGEGTAAAAAWVQAQRERLRHEPPAGVLAELAGSLARGPAPGAAGAEGLSAAELLAREVAYFHKRAGQIRYAEFRAAGYPIGSGIAESGHKVVITPRCKGAGRHWNPDHLNPLLELRTLEANGRWAEAWPRIWAERCRAARAARRRRPAARPPTPAAPPPRPPTAAPAPRPRPRTIIDGRPTRQHPWNRRCLPDRRPTAAQPII
jgi:hypothetical protein